MHNGTQLLSSLSYSLALKTAKYFFKTVGEPFNKKISFDLHTFPSKTLDWSTFHVIPGKTIPQAPKIGVTSRFFTKEPVNIKHHTTVSVRVTDEASNAILQLSNVFSSQQE